MQDGNFPVLSPDDTGTKWSWGDLKMMFFHIFKPDWKRKGHFCESYAGGSYFWKYLKEPTCGVDPQTGVAICKECGRILKPPSALEEYQTFHYTTYANMIIVLFLALGKELHWKPTTTIPIAALTVFLVSFLIPALLASLGTWTEIYLNEEAQDAFLEQQRLKISKQRTNQSDYLAYNVVLLVASILLALFVIRILKQSEHLILACIMI